MTLLLRIYKLHVILGRVEMAHQHTVDFMQHSLATQEIALHHLQTRSNAGSWVNPMTCQLAQPMGTAGLQDAARRAPTFSPKLNQETRPTLDSWVSPNRQNTARRATKIPFKLNQETRPTLDSWVSPDGMRVTSWAARLVILLTCKNVQYPVWRDHTIHMCLI